jgi:hAT family C-terminal dimerisation region
LHPYFYPTLRRIAIDYLPCQASSVPCERLFSAGDEIATKRHAQLGAARFEELQVMKFAWRNNIGDLAAWNSAQVEEVDEMKEFQYLLAADGEHEEWDKDADEFVSCF